MQVNSTAPRFGGLYIGTHPSGKKTIYTLTLVDRQSKHIKPGEVRMDGVKLGESPIIEKLSFTLNVANGNDKLFMESLPNTIKLGLNPDNLFMQMADERVQFKVRTPLEELTTFIQNLPSRLLKPLPQPQLAAAKENPEKPGFVDKAKAAFTNFKDVVVKPFEGSPEVDVRGHFKQHREALFKQMDDLKHWHVVPDRYPSRETGKPEPNRIYINMNPYIAKEQ